MRDERQKHGRHHGDEREHTDHSSKVKPRSEPLLIFGAGQVFDRNVAASPLPPPPDHPIRRT